MKVAAVPLTAAGPTSAEGFALEGLAAPLEAAVSLP